MVPIRFRDILDTVLNLVVASMCDWYLSDREERLQRMRWSWFVSCRGGSGLGKGCPGRQGLDRERFQNIGTGVRTGMFPVSGFRVEV